MNETVYLAFYKPYGVLTAFTDPEGRETLKSFIDVPGVYAAGRLDLDSEGLLLLTNDGDLAHRLTDPRYNHPKTYLVQVEGIPTPQALAQLERGVEVKGELTRRAQVMVVPEPDLPERPKPVTPHGPTTWLRIVLREGKKRQVRHMTAAVGLPTLRLLRVAVGPISLDTLQPGEWRYLTAEEVAAIREQTAAAARLSAREAPPERKGAAPRRSAAGGQAQQSRRPAVRSGRARTASGAYKVPDEAGPASYGEKKFPGESGRGKRVKKHTPKFGPRKTPPKSALGKDETGKPSRKSGSAQRTKSDHVSGGSSASAPAEKAGGRPPRGEGRPNKTQNRPKSGSPPAERPPSERRPSAGQGPAKGGRRPGESPDNAQGSRGRSGGRRSSGR
jgi:23S rRNA pseudouridine2457 synthase